MLIVDDDFALREALCSILEGEGFSVAAAANGREALDYIHSGKIPCLILLDLMMPIMNGWEFRQMQRRDPRLAEIPVVVLSAFARSDDEELGDVQHFLRKPVNLSDLLTAVRNSCA